MKKVRVTGVQILTPSMRFLTTFLNFSKLISSLKAQVCNISKNYIVLGPPGCAQVSPCLSPGLLDFFGGMKTANKPHASRNYTQDH